MIVPSAMAGLWTAVVPVAAETPDPNDVKPGWLGFLVVVLLGLAVVVLLFSFRKQLRKVDFEESPGDAAATPDGARDTRGESDDGDAPEGRRAT